MLLAKQNFDSLFGLLNQFLNNYIVFVSLETDNYFYCFSENTDDAVQEAVDLSSIPLPETQEVPEKKEVKIRPWDVGKTDFIPFVPEKRKPSAWLEIITLDIYFC